MLAYCHFHSFLILYYITTFLYIHYISQRSNAKKCFSTGLQRQVQTITRVFSLEINHRVYQIHKEGGVVNSSTPFLNPLVRTNSLYGKRKVGFFSLASRALLVRLLRHALPIFFTDFEKNRLFCSLISPGLVFNQVGISTISKRVGVCRKRRPKT